MKPDRHFSSQSDGSEEFCKRFGVDSCDNSFASRDKLGDDEEMWNDAIVDERKTQAVRGLRVILVLVLVGTAIGFALTAYRYVSNSEVAQFETQFTDEADKIMNAIGTNLAKTFTIFDGLAVTMVSSALAANETWPFVTLPNFAMRLSKVLPLSDAFVVTVLPIVSPRDHDEWEAYSLKTDGWVNESIALQETWDGYYGPVIDTWEPYGAIHGDVDDIPHNTRFVLSRSLRFRLIPRRISS